MSRYRVTYDVLIDVLIEAKTKAEAIELAAAELADRGERDIYDVVASGDHAIQVHFLGDSLKLSSVEKLGL